MLWGGSRESERLLEACLWLGFPLGAGFLTGEGWEQVSTEWRGSCPGRRVDDRSSEGFFSCWQGGSAWWTPLGRPRRMELGRLC